MAELDHLDLFIKARKTDLDDFEHDLNEYLGEIGTKLGISEWEESRLDPNGYQHILFTISGDKMDEDTRFRVLSWILTHYDIRGLTGKGCLDLFPRKDDGEYDEPIDYCPECYDYFKGEHFIRVDRIPDHIYDDYIRRHEDYASMATAVELVEDLLHESQQAEKIRIWLYGDQHAAE